jgi:glycosyltransferase involved in cell wall biosynthesis
MKVLHLDEQAGWRGGEQQASWLMQGLAARGHAVWLCGRPGSRFATDAHGGVTLQRMELPLANELDLYSALRLALLARREGVHILHAHTSHTHAIALLARQLGGRFHVVAHRRVSFPPRKGPLNRWKYLHADRMVCVSGKVLDVMRDYGIPSDKLALVYSAVDFSRLEVPPLPRATLHLPDDVPILFNAGALVGHKDQVSFVRMLDHVRREFPTIRGLIAGEGERRAEIEREIARLDLRHHVLLLGHRDDVPRLLRMADVYVSSSSSEGLGTSVLEALAAGIPVVASAAGGIPEMIRHGETGYLTAIHDPAGLAAGVCAALRDPARARAMAERGRALVHERFGTERMVDETLRVYEALLRS